LTHRLTFACTLLPAPGYEGPFCLRKQAEPYLVPEFGSAVSAAAASVAVADLTALRPFSAGGPHNSSLTRGEVFASTNVEALESLGKLPNHPSAPVALVAAKPMPSSMVDWRAHQTEIVEASSCDPNDPSARRLPFIYPGFNRSESIAGTDEDKPAVSDQGRHLSLRRVVHPKPLR
jgi:hypothetical protein